MRITDLIVLIVLLMTSLAAPLIAAAEKAGGGDITFTPKNATPVVFSHEVHLNGKGLKCSGCHFQIFVMAQGFDKMDMNRMNKGDFCGKCHDGRKSFDVKVRKNCVRCHRTYAQAVKRKSYASEPAIR